MSKAYIASKWNQYRETISPDLPVEVIEEIRNSFYCGFSLFLVVLAEAQADGLKPSEAMHAIRVESDRFMAELRSQADAPFDATTAHNSHLDKMNLPNPKTIS